MLLWSLMDLHGRIVTEAANELEKLGISAEVIDIQSLIPFDLSHEIAESVKKTNRLVVIDEDVEGELQDSSYSRSLKSRKHSDILIQIR